MNNYYAVQNDGENQPFARHSARQHLSARRSNAPEIICLNDQTKVKANRLSDIDENRETNERRRVGFVSISFLQVQSNVRASPPKKNPSLLGRAGRIHRPSFRVERTTFVFFYFFDALPLVRSFSDESERKNHHRSDFLRIGRTGAAPPSGRVLFASMFVSVRLASGKISSSVASNDESVSQTVRLSMVDLGEHSHSQGKRFAPENSSAAVDLLRALFVRSSAFLSSKSRSKNFQAEENCAAKLKSINIFIRLDRNFPRICSFSTVRSI